MFTVKQLLNILFGRKVDLVTDWKDYNVLGLQSSDETQKSIFLANI